MTARIAVAAALTLLLAGVGLAACNTAEDPATDDGEAKLETETDPLLSKPGVGGAAGTPAGVEKAAADAGDGAAAGGDAEGRKVPQKDWPIKPYADPHAVFEMAEGGTFVAELNKELAPNTVENFIRLAEQEFYDDTLFHRVLPSFMAQGGSPEGKGMGGPGWTIPLETHASLRHVRGSLAMARKRDPDSAGSQFYICYDPQPGLDDKYAVFGSIVKGMDVVDGIKKGSPNVAEMQRRGLSAPEDGFPSTLKSVRIVDGLPE
jgi:cyclophilin family peptidyl-prolyl cis-trans isomerase